MNDDLRFPNGMLVEREIVEPVGTIGCLRITKIDEDAYPFYSGCLTLQPCSGDLFGTLTMLVDKASLSDYRIGQRLSLELKA